MDPSLPAPRREGADDNEPNLRRAVGFRRTLDAQASMRFFPTTSGPDVTRELPPVPAQAQAEPTAAAAAATVPYQPSFLVTDHETGQTLWAPVAGGGPGGTGAPPPHGHASHGGSASHHAAAPPARRRHVRPMAGFMVALAAAIGLGVWLMASFTGDNHVNNATNVSGNGAGPKPRGPVGPHTPGAHQYVIPPLSSTNAPGVPKPGAPKPGAPKPKPKPGKPSPKPSPGAPTPRSSSSSPAQTPPPYTPPTQSPTPQQPSPSPTRPCVIVIIICY
jgi:hypothetical protein